MKTKQEQDQEMNAVLDRLAKQKMERVKKYIAQALLNHYQEEVPFELVLEIPVLYQGWESDEFNYIVHTGRDEKLYINSDHGSLYVDLDYENHVSSRTQDYKKSQDALDKALKLMKSKKTSVSK